MKNVAVSLFQQLEQNDMTTLIETIADAKKVMTSNDLPFATIWKTGKSYGFNFDKKEVGYKTTDCGVKRVVVAVV